MQSNEERLAFLTERQKGIGGSDIAAICGMDPYRSAFDIYLDKTRPVDLSGPENIHMLRGILLEDLGADLYSEASGHKVRRMAQRAHKDYPWAVVNADRQILAGGDRGTGALEIKSPMAYTFSNIISYGMKDAYTLQLQWALFVTGYDWGEFCAINLEHGAGPIIYFPVERDDVLINEMHVRAERFWHLHVEAGTPPTPDMWATGEPVEVPEHSGEAVTLESAEVVELARGVVAAWKMKKAAEDSYKLRKDEVISLMKKIEAVKLHVPGVGKMNHTWQPGRTTFNHKKLKLYGAIDPDKLRVELAEWDLMDGEQIDVILAECGMDFEMFEKKGNAYQQFVPYPAKEGK
jgi:putative phage-type endonuclease